MRKSFMLTVLLVITFLFASLPAQNRGSNGTFDVLYLSDTGLMTDGSSKIYSVEIDELGGVANLTLVAEVPLNHVDVLAASADGNILWLIDDGPVSSHSLGYYNLITDTFGFVGPITNIPNLTLNVIDQGAISPDNRLFVTRVTQDDLWWIDTSTAQGYLVGPIKTAAGVQVDILGADIIFGLDGTFYLWANNSRIGAPIGLYILSLPPAYPGDVIATFVGPEIGTTDFFSGLAIRLNGLANIVGSNTETDEIVELGKSDGNVIARYPMYYGGVAYNHNSGDMTLGPLDFCSHTIGYWKNHRWKGQTITICGFLIDETLGKKILRNASSKNFSMLFAQLIAAKLDTNNLGGVPEVDDAEEWLCSLGIVGNGSYWWRTNFFGATWQEKKTQKQTAVGFSEALDLFINRYLCN